MENNRYTRAEELMRQCQGLPGSSHLKCLVSVEAAELYDGIGPEWHPETIVKVFDSLDAAFEPAAFLCDVLYAVYRDRSRRGFMRVNRYFYEGCRILARRRYRWYDPRRYILYLKAKRLWRAFVEDGESSWAGWTIKEHLPGERKRRG